MVLECDRLGEERGEGGFPSSGLAVFDDVQIVGDTQPEALGEILCACQAIDFLAPLTTAPALAAVHARVRSVVPALTVDRPPAPDIEAIAALITSGSLVAAIAAEVK